MAVMEPPHPFLVLLHLMQVVVVAVLIPLEPQGQAGMVVAQTDQIHIRLFLLPQPQILAVVAVVAVVAGQPEAMAAQAVLA